MLLGLELGTWAEWITGIGSILAISAGFFYRKNDKKIQIEIKGYLYHFSHKINNKNSKGNSISIADEKTYFKINVRNTGEMDMKISEAGITNREFTYEDIWKDTEDKEYALYSFKADKQVIGKTALPLNAPWVEEKMGRIASKNDAKKLKVYAIDELDNIYYGKLKFVNNIKEKIKS